VTAQIEQVQDKKKPITGRRGNSIKNILCFNLAITLILFVLASDNLIGTFILYCEPPTYVCVSLHSTFTY
jgi:hypothetical protein